MVTGEGDEDVQCSDGGSGRDGDDVDDECVDENEIGEEVGEEVCEGAVDEEIGEELGEDGSDEQLEDGEEVQCHKFDLDYGDEEGGIAEEEEVEEEEGIEEEKEGVEEREAGKAEAEELDDEDNPNRGESSDVSCLDSDSEETNQYSSTRDNFSESGVRKERVPKVRHRKVRRSG